MVKNAMVGPRLIIIEYLDGSMDARHVLRTLCWHGKPAPMTTVFKLRGDGIHTCYICGKELPDPLSAARNIGPECIKTWGAWPGREFIEEHVKEFKAYQRKARKEGQIVAKFEDWLEIHKQEA